MTPEKFETLLTGKTPEEIKAYLLKVLELSQNQNEVINQLHAERNAVIEFGQLLFEKIPEFKEIGASKHREAAIIKFGFKLPKYIGILQKDEQLIASFQRMNEVLNFEEAKKMLTNETDIKKLG